MTEPLATPPAPRRARPKPGERRSQILQMLATMLQEPDGERVTTAALAARLKVSEAALYRHFASKAQMFEGLIAFIESTLFGLIDEIAAQHQDGQRQMHGILSMLLSFSKENPGMTRVLIGDALVTEDARLQNRINELVDRLETSMGQALGIAVAQGTLPAETDISARAGLALAYVQGCWLRFAKSGFRHSPCARFEQQVRFLIA